MIERLVDQPPPSTGEIWCVLHRQPAIRCVEMHAADEIDEGECVYGV